MPRRTYSLTVAGELDDRIGAAFPGMALTRRNGDTTFTGEIEDQAQLQAVLRRLSDFGLELLETKVVGDHTPDSTPADPASPSTHSERS